ncbi:MAG TPA: glycerophosphodiester phosphodiesterase [Candidatus Hungatella pullicola]|nr:glycerophosphodiester phosphodiesterase [Candidatus Hungatella pullicola]
MRSLTRETGKLLKYNQKNTVVFQLAYRLITMPLYLVIVNQGLELALRKAGYSYLTGSNIVGFLLKPWTIAMIFVAAVVGILLISLEAGCLITAFQGAAYSRKMDPGEILLGGLQKLIDEIRKKNWKLGLLILASYGITNLYLIYRLMLHIKPVKFVLEELFNQPVGLAAVAAGMIALAAVTIPGMYVFHICMIEQKSFRDGYYESAGMVKKHFFQSVITMMLYYAVFIAALYLLYFFCVVVMALGLTVFFDTRLGLALFPEACDRVEAVILIIASIFLAVWNTAAVSARYFHFSNAPMNFTWLDEVHLRRNLKGRLLAGGAAVAAAASLFFLFDVVRNGSSMAENMLEQIQITAHRGSSQQAPENTMAAMEQAVADMADFVEIDVQETKDGVVVLGHDSSLKRVAGVNRSIASYTFEELQQLDVGSWFSPEFEGEKIPTLEQVMEYCKGQININIEIKNLGNDSQLPDKVVELIEAYQMAEQCVVTSVNRSYLSRIKEINPDIHTGYIVSAAYGNYYSEDFMDFISLRYNFVTQNLVESAHERGKAVYAWTVNTRSELERMRILGVDNVITDNPILAREILDREEVTENILEYIRMIFKP